MNICVLSGSPKGEYSITLQTALYLQKRFPEHRFELVHVGARIKSFEKDMSEPLAAISRAELLLFCFPVYTFLAPSQLHRFIELLKASGADLAGKYSTAISTSKHFYDVTAHRYIEDNCHDMGLRVIRGLSADMEDLLSHAGQRDAEEFFKYVCYCVQNGIADPAPTESARPLPEYAPSLPVTPKRPGYDTVIVADLSRGDAGLEAMIADFRAAYPHETRLIDIGEYPFKGGCLGCFNCAVDGKCVYKDGFDAFLREQIQTADAICCAFTVSDHSMGARFKMYDDRQFCNGHRTVTEGMPFCYIVRGDLEREANLRTVIEARSEVGHNFLAGVAVDKASVEQTAKRLAYAMERRYVQPRNFYGVGGMKIFRDLIWLMRGIMKADHEFYKKRGIYDFPQKKRGQMIKMELLGTLIRSPKVKSKLGNKMNEGMVAPYKKAIGR